MTPIGFNYRYSLTKVMLTSNALYVWAWRWGWKPLRTFHFCSSREISIVGGLLAKKSIPAPLSMLPNPPPSSWILITCFRAGFRKVGLSLYCYTLSNPRTLKLISWDHYGGCSTGLNSYFCNLFLFWSQATSSNTRCISAYSNYHRFMASSSSISSFLT